jgi:hypothetical protein
MLNVQINNISLYFCVIFNILIKKTQPIVPPTLAINSRLDENLITFI